MAGKQSATFVALDKLNAIQNSLEKSLERQEEAIEKLSEAVLRLDASINAMHNNFVKILVVLVSTLLGSGVVLKLL
jgi:uncharacterized coiled-coil protein SlyX